MAKGVHRVGVQVRARGDDVVAVTWRQGRQRNVHALVMNAAEARAFAVQLLEAADKATPAETIALQPAVIG